MPQNLSMLGAAAELVGGSTLPDQLKEETDEQRRRRKLLEQMQEAVSPFGASSMLGVPARKSMLGTTY